MSLSKKLKTHLKNEVENKQSEPKFLSVEQSENGFEIKGFWEEEVESTSPWSGVEKTTETRSVQYTVEVSRDSKIGIQIEEIFSEFFDSRVSVSPPARVNSVSLGTIEDVDFVEDYEFYEPDDSDCRIFCFISAEFESVQSHELADHLVGRLQDYGTDLDIHLENIEATFSFSDFAVCELVSVMGDVETEKPHQFLSNVDSLEEFLEKSRKHSSDSKDDMFEAPFRLGEGEDWEIENNKTLELAESAMEEHFSELVDVKGDHMFEGNCIEFNGDSEYVSFFLRIPVKD